MSIHSALPITSNDFRVLFLRPNERYDAPLIGQLEIFSFDDTEKEPYDTLSYAWDKKYNDNSIELNGRVCCISKAVEKALLHIRALGHRRIWVDQLCIDQKNTQERNQQVARMNEIYASGAECFVYLGEGTGNSKDVDWMLKWVGQMLRLRNEWNPKRLHFFFGLGLRGHSWPATPVAILRRLHLGAAIFYSHLGTAGDRLQY